LNELESLDIIKCSLRLTGKKKERIFIVFMKCVIDIQNNIVLGILKHRPTVGYKIIARKFQSLQNARIGTETWSYVINSKFRKSMSTKIKSKLILLDQVDINSYELLQFDND
jgi:hypothetical protein